MPPEFTSRPWFNLTVAVAILPATQLTSTGLIQVLAAQLGMSSVTEISRIEIRLYTVRLWSPLVAGATTTLQPAIVTIFDPIQVASSAPGASRTLEEYTRYPDQVNRASIGYRYPIAQSDLVIQQPNAVTLLGYNSAMTNGLAMFQLSWRFDIFTSAVTGGILSKLF